MVYPLALCELVYPIVVYRAFRVLEVRSPNRWAYLIICISAACEHFGWGCGPRSERSHIYGPLTLLEE